MAKKQKKRSQPKRPTPPSAQLPGRIVKTLNKVEPLLASQAWEEAIPQLEALHRQYPSNQVVLGELVNACYAANYLRLYLRYLHKLQMLQPADGDILVSLAGAYLGNDYLFASFHTYQEFVRRFPAHEQAAAARKMVDEMAAGLPELLKDFGYTGDAGFPLGNLHDRLRIALDLGELTTAREIGAELLALYPDFVPALNNLSQVEFVAGNHAQAIAYAQRVLSREPENVQAAANLTRYYLLDGNHAAAHTQAQHLATIPIGGIEGCIKKAEAFAYLGDDEQVDAAVRTAEALPEHEQHVGAGLLYHLGAVAALGLDQEKVARARWQKALALAPELTIAQENLRELILPAWQRHVPWPFELQQWVPPQFVPDLQQLLQRRQGKKRGDLLVRELQAYLRAQPALLALCPILLKRGGKAGRELVLNLARFSEYPPLFDLLRTYVTSQDGPDESRGNALNLLNEFQQLPTGTTRMWIKGAWTEIMTMGFAIGESSEVEFPLHNREAEKLLREAVMLTRDGDLRCAQSRLEQANALEPDHPVILNNLAGCLEGRGDKAGAAQLMVTVREKHPDYLFGQIGWANQLTAEGKFDAARTVLNGLLRRRQLHYSEFFAMADAEMRFQFAQQRVEGVQQWLEMWRRVEPDHPGLHHWERQLALHQGVGTERAIRDLLKAPGSAALRRRR